MKKLLMATGLVLLLAASRAMAVPVVGNVVGGNDSIQVTATPTGNQWEFVSNTGKRGMVVLTIDDLRQAQGMFGSCMRMDVSGLPAGRPFPLGTVKGISFEVQRETGGRTILVRSSVGGTMHVLTLDSGGQNQLQAMFTSAMQAQQIAGGPRGTTPSGQGAGADPNTIDNAKDVMHHWRPSGY